MLPHPRLVFLLQGQMMGSPHKVVHTPAFQRNLTLIKKREREREREKREERRKEGKDIWT